MITIDAEADFLLLVYRSDLNGTRWVDDKMKLQGSVTLRRTFTFTSKSFYSQVALTDDDGTGVEDELVFVLGTLNDGYYKIDRDILGLKHDLFLSSAMTLDTKTFVAEREISVFRRIDQLINDPIVIGGNDERAIPTEVFKHLLENFPTTTELTNYAKSRITRVLKDYFGTMSDAEDRLNRYLNKKGKLVATSRESLLESFEQQKFEYIYSEFISMLSNVESYTEKEWQKKVLGLLLLIFPRYITVLENVSVKDFYSRPGKTTDRYIDLMLVDANGTIDIIEVKKPFPNALLSQTKYRDNHTPKKELAGAIMQAEKYLFHLSKWGAAGEKDICSKHQKDLPIGIKLKITNPKALILLGRDDDFSSDQRFDFEIIRRKYANMLDIMTYDDLLRRLQNIIEMIKRQTSAGNTA